MRLTRLLITIVILAAALTLSLQDASAQTSTTGDLTGVVTDPTNSVVPSAQVTLKNLDQGGSRDTKTNDSGLYRFSLLQPGRYEVDIRASGFQPVAHSTTVSIGQITTLDLKLSLQAATESMVVTEEAPLVQTQNGDLTTTLEEKEIQTMPNQGNDMTYPLLMSPGVTENTLGGYGNYSVNGISGTSNLFTVNGMDDNDPYLSVNNTGATSLMLGQNEIQEASVVSDGYSGQFGGLAGSNVNLVTKGGTDQIHGEATYYWNGPVMNANSFFRNANGIGKSFSNANQYAGDVGGPAIKDKLFWYFNTEGIRFILPSSGGAQLVPDPAFETATINNLMENHPDSVPFYQNIFKLYNAAATANHATAGIPGGGSGCGFIVTDGSQSGDPIPFAPPGVTNCVDNFLSSATLFTKEVLYSFRIDYNISGKDHIFGRVQFDRGFQGSYTDPISPLFNLVSNQPENQGQLVENHTFGPTATNQLIISGQWYSATFNAPNLPAALTAFPTTMAVNGLALLGGLDFIAPQGRNVTQVQASDDLTKTVGRHTLKFGVKYRRNDVTDLVYGENTSGTLSVSDLDAFYNGGFDPAYVDEGGDVFNNSSYSQFFPANTEQRFKFWNVGAYAEDDIQVTSSLTLNLSLRGDHFSNPTCKDLCFSRLVEPFTQLLTDSTLGGANAANIPYSEIFLTNQKTDLVGVTNIEWQPRLGFAWQPFGREHSTVVRGGIGIFYDAFPGTVVDDISSNPPLGQTFNVGGETQPLLISPAENTNVFQSAAASNAGFLFGFASGETEAELAASVPGFTPPAVNYVNTYTKVPQYQKWSLQIQQGLGKDTSVTVGYEGNHGIHETIQDGSLNAYASGFAGLPSVAPDPRFGYVRGIFDEAVSNYNGLSVTATHRYSTGQISASYTYSHAFDETSNGGFSPFSYQAFLATNTSPIYAEQPYNLRSMYSSSDYDARHYFSLHYLWELPFKKITMGHGPDSVLKGWNVSGTVLARTGLPFSVVDLGTTENVISNYGPAYGADGPAPEVFATLVPGQNPGTCSGPGSNAFAPCFNTAAFTTSKAGFGDAGRNSMRGPGYFNTDFSVWKGIHVIPHRESSELDIGFQFYNVLNHPNFDNPIADVSNTSQFGIIQRTISPATTIYGVALGADASPRLVQVKAEFKF